MCLGASGKLLILRIPLLNKLAVFDLRAAKIAGYIPTGGDEVLFAAGAEKLVLIRPVKMIVQRYRLDNLHLERTAPLAVEGRITAAAIGASSSGPLLVFTSDAVRGTPVFLDVDSLKPGKYEFDKGMPFTHYKVDLRASADGRVFTAWNLEVGPSGVRVLTIRGNRVYNAYEHQSAGYLCPDEYGERIYSAAGIYTNQAKRIGDGPPDWGTFLVPAVHGPLYLRISGDDFVSHRKAPRTLTVHLAGDIAPLAVLPDMGERLGVARDRSRPPKLDMDQRVYLVPGAEVLAVLPDTLDCVVVRRFNLEEELKKSGIDYLVVVSRPPRAVRPGATFEYQLDVRSKAGRVECRLDSGPSGMQVSKTGLVRWIVKDLPEGKSASVTIAVTDASAQKVLHSFDLTVGEESDMPATPSVPPAAAKSLPRAVPPPPTPSLEWQLTKVDDHRLKMSDGDAVLVPGLQYRSMLLLQGDHLAVLAADGITILRIHKLGTAYKRIAERAEYYVAIAEDPPAIDLLDKKTLATIRRIPCSAGGLLTWRSTRAA